MERRVFKEVPGCCRGGTKITQSKKKKRESFGSSEFYGGGPVACERKILILPSRKGTRDLLLGEISLRGGGPAAVRGTLLFCSRKGGEVPAKSKRRTAGRNYGKKRRP